MRAAGLFAAFALVAAPAAASEPVRSGQIWTGTLGDQAITACFDEQYASGGLYYVDAALTPIRLEPLEKAAAQGHLFAQRAIAQRIIRGDCGVWRIPIGLFMVLRILWVGFKLKMKNQGDDRIRRLA